MCLRRFLKPLVDAFNNGWEKGTCGKCGSYARTKYFSEVRMIICYRCYKSLPIQSWIYYRTWS